jgi:hypothetical protein
LSTTKFTSSVDHTRQSAAFDNQARPSTLDFALQYLEQGIRSVPLYPRSKQPIGEGWQDQRLNADQFRAAFNNGQNIGILTGEASGGLADIDLDCDEALNLVRDYLPETSSAFGRGNCITHRLFRVTPADFKTEKFEDPATMGIQKCMLIELRGAGLQTMAPPSVHPDTDQIVEWYARGDPRLIGYAELLKHVERLAAASLLARHWPPLGARNHIGLALAGALFNAGWTDLEVEAFINPVAKLRGDAKTQEIRSTFKRVREGKSATGQPTCAEVFGEKVWSKVAEWLHLRQAEPHVWGEPIPLDTPPLPPLSETVFDPAPWLRNMAKDVAEATETPFELAALHGFGAVAAAVQKKAIVQIQPGYCEPLNIYANAALESGNRKTKVMEHMTGPLLKWEAEQMARVNEEARDKKSQRETEEACIKEMRIQAAKASSDADRNNLKQKIMELERNLPEVPRPPQLWAQDVTPEALGGLMADNGERMAIISDEAGIFELMAGRYSNGVPNLDLFLKGHSGSPFRVNRGSRPPVMMQSPALTMVLSSQPDLLAGLSSKPNFRGSGLLARFLCMLPASLLGRRTRTKGPVPDKATKSYDKNIRLLLEQKPTREPGDEIDLENAMSVIELDADAYQEWFAFGGAVEPELLDGGKYEFIKDWAGKLPGAAIRIAGLLHCAKHAGKDPALEKLTQDTMQCALAFAAVLSAHALAVFDLMGADPALKAARKLWTWIERNGSAQFTFRNAWHALRGTFSTAEDIEPAFKVLVERDYISPLESGARHGVGRPSRTFEVNPSLVSHRRRE